MLQSKTKQFLPELSLDIGVDTRTLDNLTLDLLYKTDHVAIQNKAILTLASYPGASGEVNLSKIKRLVSTAHACAKYPFILL